MRPFNLEEYLANPSKKIITRNGKDVRIICTNFNNKYYPVIIEVKGNNSPISVTKNGKYLNSKDTDLDIFFATKKKEGWINIFKGGEYHYAGDAFIYKSKEDAEKQGKFFSDYITTSKIEWEE